MLAILAILSDIPTYVLSLVEQLSGKDMTSVSTMIGDIFSAVIDFVARSVNRKTQRHTVIRCVPFVKISEFSLCESDFRFAGFIFFCRFDRISLKGGVAYGKKYCRSIHCRIKKS